MAYAFIAHTSIKWRAVYWFCFGFELFAFVMVILFYKPPTFKTKHGHEGVSKLDLLKRFDYLGLVLFAAGMTLLLLGINWVRPPPAHFENNRGRAVANDEWFLGRWCSSVEERVYDHAHRGRRCSVGGPRRLVEVQYPQLPAGATSSVL